MVMYCRKRVIMNTFKVLEGKRKFVSNFVIRNRIFFPDVFYKSLEDSFYDP